MKDSEQRVRDWFNGISRKDIQECSRAYTAMKRVSLWSFDHNCDDESLSALSDDDTDDVEIIPFREVRMSRILYMRR